MRRWAIVMFSLGALAAGCVLPRPIHRTEPRAEPASSRPAVAAAAPAALRSAEVGWQVIGRSVEDREIRVRRVGHGARQVLWIGGIHGTEREGSTATRMLPRAFLDTPGLADAVTLTLIEDVNPDGSAAGTRGNSRGVDLNRNFPARNFRPSTRTGTAPLDQPEARVLHEVISTLRPHLVLVAHSAGGRHFINYDGPAAGLAQVFSRHSGYPVVVSDQLHSTPGSLGSWVGRDMGVPILTLEYRRGTDPDEAWRQTREAILAVLAVSG